MTVFLVLAPTLLIKKVTVQKFFQICLMTHVLIDVPSLILNFTKRTNIEQKNTFKVRDLS